MNVGECHNKVMEGKANKVMCQSIKKGARVATRWKAPPDASEPKRALKFKSLVDGHHASIIKLQRRDRLKIDHKRGASP
jgi:hypothetical protein